MQPYTKAPSLKKAIMRHIQGHRLNVFETDLLKYFIM